MSRRGGRFTFVMGKSAYVASMLLAASVAEAGPRIGVSTDVGVPDGAMASLVASPVSSVRVHAGLGHNLISRGVRGGLTWIPLSTVVAPTLSVAAGYYPEGDANPLARMLGGAGDSATLARVGYTFVDAYAGLQLGGGRVALTLEAGASRVAGTLYDLGGTSSPSMAGAEVAIAPAPVVAWSVSARVGLVVFFSR